MSSLAAHYLLNAKRGDLAEIEARYGVAVEVIPEGENEGAKMRVGSSGPRVANPPVFEPIVDLDEEDYHDDSPRRPNPESPWNERNRTIENGTDSPSDDRRNR